MTKPERPDLTAVKRRLELRRSNAAVPRPGKRRGDEDWQREREDRSEKS